MKNEKQFYEKLNEDAKKYNQLNKLKENLAKIEGNISVKRKLDKIKLLQTYFDSKYNNIKYHTIEIPGYENFKISNYGTVINTETNNMITRRLSHNKKLVCCNLRRNNSQKTIFIHKLVASYFIEEPIRTVQNKIDNIYYVPCFKDESKLYDCSVNNICYKQVKYKKGFSMDQNNINHGKMLSDECCAIMSKNFKEKRTTNILRKKLSESHTGYKNPRAKKCYVIEYDLSDELLYTILGYKIFNSSADVNRFYNLPKCTASNYARKNQNKHDITLYNGLAITYSYDVFKHACKACNEFV